MWRWMEVVKGVPLAQDGPSEARCEHGETLDRATEAGGGPRTVGAGVAAGALAMAFAYLFVAPQESVPKRAWPQQSRDSAAS